MRRVYKTMDDFYVARGGRLSGERDFGVMWNAWPRKWPHYRVSVVQDTGDVYAVALSGDKIVTLLGNVGTPDAYDEAERRLEGWADKQRSLGWVARRVT